MLGGGRSRSFWQVLSGDGDRGGDRDQTWWWWGGWRGTSAMKPTDSEMRVSGQSLYLGQDVIG